MHRRILLAAGIVFASLLSQPLAAQTAPKPKRAAPVLAEVSKGNINAWTVGLAGGLLEGALHAGKCLH